MSTTGYAYACMICDDGAMSTTGYAYALSSARHNKQAKPHNENHDFVDENHDFVNENHDFGDDSLYIHTRRRSPS
ncbi:hypothetical protein [Nostoc sp.]|uniref:hypothetical protein n=1 Tax=Nostoc sp. TaxID=1180 RepID=UPI002FFD1277